MAREDNRILKGDCVEQLARLNAGSVDLVFADPPFNIGYDYDVYDDSKEYDDYLKWSERWMSGVKRALKPNGTFWLAIGDEYAAELKVLARKIGFHCRSWVIWYYTFGVNCKNKYSRSHAHLFHFVVDQENFTFHSDRIPSARQLVYGDARANPTGRLPDDTWILRPQDCVDGFTANEDTWYFPRVAGTFKERAGFHGCQMPEQLLGRIIRSCSNLGDLVLDPFSGSATTLVVAKKLGRRFLGFDISDDYIARGTARLEGVRPGDPLEGAAEPLVSAPATDQGVVRADRVSDDLLSRASTPVGKRQRSSETARSRKAPLPVAASAARTTPPPRTISPELADQLLAAYDAVRDGYSLDRVIADPEMNNKLEAACRKAGMAGSLADWNRMLFRLRKAGRLADLPATQRTEFGWQECDRFIDGCEIAWRLLADETKRGLDDLFCDPELAARFDHLVSEIAGGVPPLAARWGALKLRKGAKISCSRAARLEPVRIPGAKAAAEIPVQTLSGRPGLYIVTAGRNDVLYVGQTFDLGTRLKRSFQTRSGATFWDRTAGGEELKIRVLELGGAGESENQRASALLARQAALVLELKPRLNAIAQAVS